MDRDAALAELTQLPGRWAAAIDGLCTSGLLRRPRPDRWSIAEYTDHVRETVFGMRFILDVAVDKPGVDLSEPPTPRFDPQPRHLHADTALMSSATRFGLRRDLNRRYTAPGGIALRLSDGRRRATKPPRLGGYFRVLPTTYA